MKFFIILLSILSSLVSKVPSVDEMIAQMIMVGMVGTTPDDKLVKQIRDEIESNKIGGVIFFGHNIKNPLKLKKLTRFLLSTKAKLPIFLGIDQEGGVVQRLNKKNGFTKYPSAFEISATRTLEQSYAIYKKMANELSLYGFNINFAPVVDLNINQNSPAIGAKNRSYSKSASRVISFSREFILAQRDAKIISVIKHFPGHGSAVADSHKKFTDISRTWEFEELKPYYEFIREKSVDAVMVGHITLDRFDKRYPSSLSKKIITTLLREKLKFKGVVFSDDMEMKAISEFYGFKESIVLAINAGVNVLLFSSYLRGKKSIPSLVHGIIYDALKSGRISREKIEFSYNKIVRLKNVFN